MSRAHSLLDIVDALRFGAKVLSFGQRRTGHVKLLFIYGPPAVGKLTVAKQLAQMTGFRLHHNHVSVDFVKSIFEFGTPTFQALVDRYRRDILGAAASEGVDTIFTYVYNKGRDDDFVRDIIQRVESNKGRFCPVRLHCDRRELLKRVSNKSRANMGKLTSSVELNELFERYNLDHEIPGKRSLTINTETVAPKSAARAIVHHYRLESGQ